MNDSFARLPRFFTDGCKDTHQFFGRAQFFTIPIHYQVFGLRRTAQAGRSAGSCNGSFLLHWFPIGCILMRLEKYCMR